MGKDWRRRGAGAQHLQPLPDHPQLYFLPDRQLLQGLPMINKQDLKSFSDGLIHMERERIIKLMRNKSRELDSLMIYNFVDEIEKEINHDQH